MDLNILLTAMDADASNLTFFNPALSALGISVSVVTGSVQIRLSEPFDKNNRGFAKKGEKRYDWDNSISFGLTINECLDISRNFEALVAGTFKREKDNFGKTVDEKYQNMISFQHATRKIFLGPIDSKMSGGKSLRIGAFDSEKGKSVSYVFRESELILFKKFLDNAVSLLPFMTSFVTGIGKLIKLAMYKTNNGTTYSKEDSKTTKEETSSGGNDFTGIFDGLDDKTEINIPKSEPAKETVLDANPFGNIFGDTFKVETPKKQEASSDYNFDF